MEFELDENLREVQQWTRDFVKANCAKDYIRELDDKREFPAELYQKIADAGFLQIGAPEEWGGTGPDILAQTIVCEELSRGMQGSAMTWFTTSCFGVQTIGAYGTDEQKKRLMPGILDGSIKFALSITEPGGGTDVLGHLDTRAEKTASGWRINGGKLFTTGADTAAYLVVVCRTSPVADGKKHKGITALLVDPRQEGVSMAPIRTIGLNTVDSFTMGYSDVEVGDDAVLGEPGEGWSVLTHTLNNERILTAAMCVGIAQAALDDALDYATQREAFGKPIGQYQAIAHKIVEMKLAIEQARLLTYRAAWMQSKGLPCGPEATMATLAGSRMVSAVADSGIQILGGLGYTMDADMQRYWRDTRQLRIGPISNEMSANYIATTLGLPKSY